MLTSKILGLGWALAWTLSTVGPPTVAAALVGVGTTARPARADAIEAQVLAADESKTGKTGGDEEDDTATDDNAKQPLVVEEIVVKAQLRPENLQEIPFAITAYSDLEIEEAGIQTPEELLALTSNITLGDSFTVGNSFVTVRGLTQVNNADPPVAVVVDGVYQANQKQLNQELFDIERIEILRGPQGSIYGRNSVGGVINIVTKEPTSDFGGFVDAGVGNGDTYRLAGSINRALAGDRLLGRLAASKRESDGLIENAFLDEKADFFDDTTVRGRLRLVPRENVSLDLRAQTSESEGGAVLYSLLDTTVGANAFDVAPQENILGFSKRDIDDYTLLFEWGGQKTMVTSISGFTDLQETFRGDLDFTNPISAPATFQLGSGQDLDVSYLSQELRLASTSGGKVDWHVGGYYLETDRQLVTIPFLDTDGTITGFVPLFLIGEDNDNEAYAFFGHAEVELSDSLAFVGGLRYDRDSRHQTDIILGGDRQRSWEEWQPRLTLKMSRSDHLMGYLTASRGFRSGGYNAPIITPDFFDKEVADNFEVGFKSTLADDRVRLNGSAYLTAVDNFQFFQVDLVTTSQIIANIDEVEMRGVEIEMLAKVKRGLDILAAFGFNDSSIEDFDGSGRFEGNQSPNNIRMTGNLAVQYNRPISERAVVTLRLDVEHRGKQYWHPDNLDVTKARTFAHARVGLDFESWAITAWGRNLFDEGYWAEYFDASWAAIPSGMDVGWLGKPRTFGVDLRVRF